MDTLFIFRAFSRGKGRDPRLMGSQVCSFSMKLEKLLKECTKNVHSLVISVLVRESNVDVFNS